MSVRKAIARDIVISTFPSAKELIQRLIAIGWIRRIPTESPARGALAPLLYLADMEATKEEALDPLELLQGYRPDGVLCYFGVLGHHGLTTQVAPFFHVAFLKESPLPLSRAAVSKPAKSTGAKVKYDPLGRKVFNFEGVSCYLTKRNPAFVPGIQTRIVGSRTILRMTTIEQSLLDTLGHPLHCGGESVVFEAWERGASQWNTDRLAEYLEEIDLPELDRRVGAMLDTLEIKADSQKLNTRLEAVRQCRADAVELPLLRGFSYPNLNRTWNIRVP